MKIICSNCQAENDENSKYCSTCGYALPVKENESSKPTEEVKVKKTIKKYDLKTVVGAMVGFAVMSVVSHNFFKPSVDKQLAEMASEMNKTCPMTVDEYTTLKNVVALPDKTVQYNYVLEKISKAEVNLDTVKKYVFSGVLENAKTNPGMKVFRENKVTMIYHYSDKDGKFVTDYVVKPEMYE